jgi:hypothetical protein
MLDHSTISAKIIALQQLADNPPTVKDSCGDDSADIGKLRDVAVDMLDILCPSRDKGGFPISARGLDRDILASEFSSKAQARLTEVVELCVSLINAPLFSDFLNSRAKCKALLDEAAAAVCPFAPLLGFAEQTLRLTGYELSVLKLVCQGHARSKSPPGTYPLKELAARLEWTKDHIRGSWSKFDNLTARLNPKLADHIPPYWLHRHNDNAVLDLLSTRPARRVRRGGR